MNDDQRREHLRAGNEIRLRRSRLRREIKSGQTKLAPLILNTPDWLEKQSVEQALVWLNGVGPTKARKWLAIAGVPPGWTFGRLTQRMRIELRRHVDPHERETAWRGYDEDREPFDEPFDEPDDPVIGEARYEKHLARVAEHGS